MLKNAKTALSFLVLVVLQSNSMIGVGTKSESKTMTTSIAYQLSYRAGHKDTNKNWIGGTETMSIVSHKGKLYAGLGYWMDLPYGKAKNGEPWTGSQIIVKDSEDSPWKLDAKLGETTIRIESLVSAFFTNDKHGKSLDKPVNMLISSATVVYPNALFVWVRDDETNQWIKTKVSEGENRQGARALGFHQDAETHASMVFAGSNRGEIYSGYYDETIPGKLSWNSEAELVDKDGRAMAFTVANGKLYCSVGRSLYERVDGISPRWTPVYQWDTSKPSEGYNYTIMRGLTTIPNPSGQGEVILGSREVPGVIERIDPLNNYHVSEEINVADYFSALWGVKKRNSLMAYNDMVPFSLPGYDKPVHLIGLQMHHPDKTIDKITGYYMIRWPDGTYTHEEMHNPTLSNHPEPRAIRCFRESPWTKGVFYAGGFDCNKKVSHNTAWIMKGSVKKEKDTDPNLTGHFAYK